MFTPEKVPSSEAAEDAFRLVLIGHDPLIQLTPLHSAEADAIHPDSCILHLHRHSPGHGHDGARSSGIGNQITSFLFVVQLNTVLRPYCGLRAELLSAALAYSNIGGSTCAHAMRHVCLREAE